MNEFELKLSQEDSFGSSAKSPSEHCSMKVSGRACRKQQIQDICKNLYLPTSGVYYIYMTNIKGVSVRQGRGPEPAIVLNNQYSIKLQQDLDLISMREGMLEQ